MKQITLLMVPLILGCGISRKAQTILKNTAEKNSSTQETHLAQQDWNRITIDSLLSETDVMLWPKGIIKISATGIFEGEINKIQIRKKEMQKRNIAESVTASQKMVALAGHHEAQREQSNYHTKNTNSILWWGASLIIFTMALIFWRLFKR